MAAPSLRWFSRCFAAADARPNQPPSRRLGIARTVMRNYSDKTALRFSFLPADRFTSCLNLGNDTILWLFPAHRPFEFSPAPSKWSFRRCARPIANLMRSSTCLLLRGVASHNNGYHSAWQFFPSEKNVLLSRLIPSPKIPLNFPRRNHSRNRCNQFWNTRET